MFNKDIMGAVFSVLKLHDISFEEVLAYAKPKPSENQGKPSEEMVIRAQEYIDRHYHDHDMSAKDISDHLHISTVYFSKIFKEHTGVTFIAYLTNVRINKAAELLTEKDQKACTVAFSVGYSDPFYFTRVFKKSFGMPPSRYKELLKGMPAAI